MRRRQEIAGAEPSKKDIYAGLGDAVLQSMTLESLMSAHVYHRWLIDLALPYLGERPIELGSGLGDYAEVWLAAGVPELTVTDLDPVRLEILQRRFANRPQVVVETVDLFHPPKRDHSCLIAYNVLEHIENDAEALAAAHDLLAPGGAVVMFVPAFPFAMGEFDRKVGHFRRYTKRTLRLTYESAGLRVERLHYVNAPGLFAWFVGMRLLRMTPMDSPIVRLWDRVVTRAERSLERRVTPPFGQSAFAVGRVPG